ncbi:MAG: fibronectin type III domain-containing protein [Solirubrobacteraceae bacterium]
MALVAAAAVFGPGVAAGAQIATTGGVTSLTKTSAALQGTVDATDPDTGYVFQYGTTTAYGKATTLKTIANPGVVAVSLPVEGLSPGATYHFRLVVAQGSYPSKLSYGADKSFRTLGTPPPGRPVPGSGHRDYGPFGRASLRSHRLRVHGDVVAIPLQCRGPRGTSCAGTVIVTERGRLGRGKKVKAVRCSRIGFSLPAGISHTFRTGVNGDCLTLLRRARGHQHQATLRATFSTHQRPLRTTVTLVRRP